MILDSFRVTDRVAIVTGAGHGIGRAIAVALAEAGADVVVAARTQKDIDETAAQVSAAGRTGVAVVCDVRETAQLENLVKVTLERFGRIDILVNNAGGMIPRPSLALSERAFEKIVRFNLTSPFLLTKLVVPHMVKIAGSGAIVNISSGASVQVVGGLMPYGAAKAGLDQMTHMLGSEFAPEVRVNSIVVGQIDTPGASSVISDELKQRAAANIPMGRMGRSSDIAACVLYLASPASCWVTGRTIAVNGGADHPPLAFPIPSLREQVLGAQAPRSGARSEAKPSEVEKVASAPRDDSEAESWVAPLGAQSR